MLTSHNMNDVLMVSDNKNIAHVATPRIECDLSVYEYSLYYCVLSIQVYIHFRNDQKLSTNELARRGSYVCIMKHWWIHGSCVNANIQFSV